MFPFRSDPVVRIRIPPRDGETPRQHPRYPHPPAKVAKARHLVETTGLPLFEIARRLGVAGGTLSRWAEKHGWTRPAHAYPLRGSRRHNRAAHGRVLSQRLRVQADRLVREIESAPQVDPAALAEAQRLLAAAREAAAIHHRPTPRRPRAPDPLAGEPPKPRKPRDRSGAARRGWSKRWSRAQRYAFLKQKE